MDWDDVELARLQREVESLQRDVKTLQDTVQELQKTTEEQAKLLSAQGEEIDNLKKLKKKYKELLKITSENTADLYKAVNIGAANGRSIQGLGHQVNTLQTQMKSVKSNVR